MDLKVKRINTPSCDKKDCNKTALYKFTDARPIEVNISYSNESETTSSYEVVTLGYSCEHCVEDVNKMLKESYKE